MATDAVTFILSDIVGGKLQVGGKDQMSFTMADIANGLVTFVHDADSNVAPSFTMTVTDGVNAFAVQQLFQFVVPGLAPAAPEWVPVAVPSDILNVDSQSADPSSGGAAGAGGAMTEVRYQRPAPPPPPPPHLSPCQHPPCLNTPL